VVVGVPGEGVGVAGVLGVVDVEVGVVGTVRVVVVVVVAVDVEVEVVCWWAVVPVLADVIVLSGAVVTVPLQSLFASARTVLAALSRSETSVGLTEPGRLATWVWTFPISVSAPAHSPFDTSVEAWLSSAVSSLPWPEESRPEPLPQAARNSAASPSPPAWRARET
jgi:hypothetical protein